MKSKKEIEEELNKIAEWATALRPVRNDDRYDCILESAAKTWEVASNTMDLLDKKADELVRFNLVIVAAFFALTASASVKLTNIQVWACAISAILLVLAIVAAVIARMPRRFVYPTGAKDMIAYAEWEDSEIHHVKAKMAASYYYAREATITSCETKNILLQWASWLTSLGYITALGLIAPWVIQLNP